MAIVINSNFSARQIQHELGRNTASTQKVITQLSSGKRLTSPMDGGADFAVSHKLASAMRRNEATTQGVQNAQSYLETQSGGLRVLGEILNRMRELHVNYRDVSKNADDGENYNYEFKELTKQLAVLSKEQFNGVSLFSTLSDYISGKSDINVTLDETGTEIANFKKPVLEGSLIDNILLYGEDKGLAIFDDTTSKQKDQFTISGSVAKDDVFSFKFEYADVRNGQHISETISYTATATDEAATDPQQSVRDALIAAANAKISSVATAFASTTNTFSIEGVDTRTVFKVSDASSSATKASYTHTTVAENKNGQQLTLAGTVEEGNIFSIGLTDQDGNSVTVSTDPLSAGSTIANVRDALVSKINATENLDVIASAGTADEDIVFSPKSIVESNASGSDVVVVYHRSDKSKTTFTGDRTVADMNGDDVKNSYLDTQLSAIVELANSLKDQGKGDTTKISLVEVDNSTESTNSSSSAKLDLSFVIDVTGSMGGTISSVKSNISSIIDTLESSGTDYNVSVSIYGDNSTYTYNSGKLMSNKTDIINSINDVSIAGHGVGGGGDLPEDGYDAIASVSSSMDYRTGSSRHMIFFTDATSHSTGSRATYGQAGTLTALNNSNVKLHAFYKDNDSSLISQYSPLVSGTSGTTTNLYSSFSSTLLKTVQDISEEVSTKGQGKAIDMDLNLTGNQILELVNKDSNGNGTSDLEEVISGIDRSSATTYTTVMAAANTILSSSTSGASKNLIYLNDGSAYVADGDADLTAIKALGTNIRAYGLGSNVNLAKLKELDSKAQLIENRDDLIDILAGKKNGFDINSVSKDASHGTFATTTDAVAPVAQEDTLTISAGTVLAGDTFSVSIGGVNVSTGALVAGASLADIRSILIATINAAAGIPVTAASGTNTDEIKLTSNTAGTAFTTTNPITTATGALLTSATTKTNVAGVEEVHTVTLSTGTILDGDFFYMNIDGTEIKTDALAATNTTSDARDALITKINASGLAVTASVSGTDQILVTANVEGATHQVGPDVWKNSPAGAFNAGLSQAQVDKITISPDTAGEIAKGDVFNFSVNGTAFAYTASAGDSAQTVRDYFVTQINAGSLGVTAANDATTNEAFTITADTVGDGFLIEKSIPNAADSLAISHISFANPLNSLDILTNFMALNGSASARLTSSNNLNSQNMLDHEKSLGLLEGLDFAKASAMLAKVTALGQMGSMMLAQANRGSDLTLVVMSLA